MADSRRTRIAIPMAVVVLCALAACTGADRQRSESQEESQSRPLGPDPCAPGPGRRVEMLPDVVIPTIEVPLVRDGDGTVVLGGFVIEQQIVDAGCVIRYDAPGGCLGAVEITAASIPAAVLPEATLGGRVYSSVTVAGVSRPSVRAEQVCQVQADGKLLTVSRAGAVRQGFSRNGASRPGGTVAGLTVPAVRLEPVRVPDVDVEPERLERREVTPTRVDVFEGDDRIAYVAPSRVLFDSDQAVIRPAAVAALREIARGINDSSPGARLLVEGHTDDRGDAAYGLGLSQRRAQAVADWLVEEAGFSRSLLEVRGYGEAAPVVPNTSAANRQQNRRVVITAVVR